MTTYCTLYEKKTGRILSSFFGNESTIAENETDEIGVFQGKLSFDVYIDDKMNVVEIPSRQFEYQIFDFITKSYKNDESLLVKYRNLLLQSSDWTQLPDVPLETKQAWAIYRQALRDITTQQGYPFEVIWPIKPE
jgi:hypothetical protein